MEIEKLKLKCKKCGNIIGTIKDNFKFGEWCTKDDPNKSEEENKKDHIKWILERANEPDGLGFLTHNHLTCYCEGMGDGILKLVLEEDSDFDIVE